MDRYASDEIIVKFSRDVAEKIERKQARGDWVSRTERNCGCV